MKELNNNYSAIILSSSCKEDEKFLIGYLKHLTEICKSVEYKYSVLPVLVFEKFEEKKKFYIEKKIESQNLKIKPLLLINKDGKGFASCLNYGIKNTNSEFIFRLDTDDRTNPKRIIDQLDLMNSQEIDISSGYMEDQNGKVLKYPTKFFGIGIMMALGTNPIAHPSVCIRKESLFLSYDKYLERCEDFDLWIRYFVTESRKIKVFKNPLTKYNTVRSFNKDKENAIAQIKIRFKYIKKSLIQPLLNSGFAVVSINHRSSTDAIFPAQIHDVKAAIRFIRANTKQYQFDSSFIGITGSSSGGHLSAMAGTTSFNKEMEGEVGPHLEFESHVDAVVDWFGPTDFLIMDLCGSKLVHDDVKSPESKLIGGAIQENKAKARAANPMTYINDKTPPFLIIHGMVDLTVPYCQSKTFKMALDSAKVENRLISIRDGAHGRNVFKKEIQEEMVSFFEDKLNNTK